MTFIEFMKQRVGSRWIVLDRRTKQARARWSGFTLLTRKQFKAMKADYEAATGNRPW